ENLDTFYSGTYYQGEDNAFYGYRDYTADRSIHLKNSQVLLSVIERAATGSGCVLLDVGCAHGFFLRAAQARGWLPHGVDMSAEAVEYARRDLGLAVTRGNIDDCRLPPLSVDVVTLIGTIEHLTDPMRTLRSAARLLRSGGLLAITTPDIEGRLGYFSWKPPEHLFYFSARTLPRHLFPLSDPGRDTSARRSTRAALPPHVAPSSGHVRGARGRVRGDARRSVDHSRLLPAGGLAHRPRQRSPSTHLPFHGVEHAV